ncbi:helix-turn-helix domain-containing protein [Acetanaerobacterium elongatum]|uniref:DNA-binding transcriptional regulator, XRE-family HTH domain n=1 Tax=Acetanaerobacterium elongatum TaxID=258515 RepID=A0A1H0GED3_9FIRM|nr:helix-turn-helix transcriptional regulator [Acetanaerobacterium elongatum]SDO05109.1 DNA-binding transcriptional regulator, XRE-family HTH domain [Acetanaerobacterium elongatum]
MEFNEKLQQLRKQNSLTQEQLAEQLYVSRTAISKWESGKGYPNIDSLKCISKLFSISIDELLSSEELITLAQNENRQNIGKIFGLVNGILDIIVGTFIVLPLFSQQEGEHFLSVPLIHFDDATPWITTLSFIFLITTAVVGIIELVIHLKDNEKLWHRASAIALLQNSLAVLFFIASRQLYVATSLFLFIMVKGVLLIKAIRMK